MWWALSFLHILSQFIFTSPLKVYNYFHFIEAESEYQRYRKIYPVSQRQQEAKLGLHLKSLV